MTKDFDYDEEVQKLEDALYDYEMSTAVERTQIYAEYKEAARKEIERRHATQRREFGRAIALSPLPVGLKRRITQTTTPAKYKGLIEASGEVDISSQYGRAMQKVKRLQNEIDKNSRPQKTELGKKEGR